jgi:hypothetical protein
MANWIKQPRKGGMTPEPIPLVTFRNNQIAFNSIFIESNKLTEHKFVVIYTIQSEFKIGFKFIQDTAANDDDAYSLSQDGGSKTLDKKTSSRVIQVQALMKEQKWLYEVSQLSDAKLRRFEPVWNKFDDLWIVQLSPAFEKKVSERSLIPSTVVGIYRYKRGEEIVYIGKGEIKSRLGSSEREAWDFDLIEYSEIHSVNDQFKWESYWIDKFLEEHGRLPFYNRISGRKQIES